MPKILTAAALLFTLTFSPAFAADEQKGTMEKIGASMDDKWSSAKDFFSDSAVKARVVARIMKDDSVPARDISVSVNEGVATLSGDAPSDEIAQRAVDITRATEGVKDVVNKLNIIQRVPSQAK
ncbi:MAG: BON domain-containing protein [Nitrospinae bacterium]|nr:BON domain-containing protein [Nitrospinota bacterium]